MGRPDKLWRYFKFRLRSFLSRMIFIFLFCFLVFPLVVLATYNNYNSLESTYDYFYAIAAVLLVLGFVFPIGFFFFTNAKNSSDFYFALPIKRQDLFIHNYLIGIIVPLLPVTLAVASGLFTLHLYGSPFLGENLLMYGKIVLFYLTINNLVTLIIQKCNNRFDSFLASLILINLPLSLYYAIVVFLENTLLGFPPYENFYLLAFISPLFSIFYTWLSATPLYIFVIYLLALLLVPILASVLFYSRKPEKSADASTSRMIYPLMSYVFTFNVFLLSYLTTSNLNFRPWFTYLFAIILALLVFLSIRMLATRGFKNLFRPLKIFVVYILAIIIALTTIRLSGGFGYEAFVPEPETVLYIEVREDFLASIFKDDPGHPDYLIIKQQKVISEFTQLQTQLINYRLNPQHSQFTLYLNYQRAVFNYKRRYGVSEAFLPYSFYYEILDNKIWLASYQPLLNQRTEKDWLLVSIDDSLHSGGRKIVGSQEKTAKLLSALETDLYRLDTAAIYQNSGLPVCYLSFSSGNLALDYSVAIFPSFINTLELLAAYEYEIPQVNSQLIAKMSISAPLYHIPYFNTDSLQRQRIDLIDVAFEQWSEYLAFITPLYISEQPYSVIVITLIDNSSQVFAYTK